MAYSLLIYQLMKEVGIHISDRIARLEFNSPALEASFAGIGKPVTPKFVDSMRTTLVGHARAYRNDLLTPTQIFKTRVEDIERQPDSLAKTVLLWQKQLAENNRTNLAATRKAFQLLGQEKAVLDVEVAVASNYIMQDLGNK